MKPADRFALMEARLELAQHRIENLKLMAYGWSVLFWVLLASLTLSIASQIFNIGTNVTPSLVIVIFFLCWVFGALMFFDSRGKEAV